MSPDEAWEHAYDTDPETWVGSPWEDDYKQGMAEGYETTPFGSVNDQRPQMPVAPQQDREAQEQAQERQARINNFREKKQDLLQQFAQLGTLRTEMIHGLDNDVFLNKDQLIDFFKQQIDDPSLTALEYAYENNIPTDGLIRHILRRATQLGISMLDVRKMFSQAKQKLGENIGRKVDAKGRTQSEWMQLVKQKFPDAKIVQAKMIDGPAHAMLPDGRKFSWTPVQGVAEVGQNFRRGNAQRAALNAMSPEERKAHEDKRAEQQRKRDEARLERERQRNAAKKGVVEGNDDDYGPELDALKKEFGKFTTHYDRMDTDPAYAASYNRQQTDRQNRDMPDDAEDDFMSDRTHDMAEGQRMGEYGRVLSALGLYVPDKFSMEELNTPDWHRVIASKADVPVEYAGKVIDDFTRPVDGHDDDEWPEDDDENVTEGKPKEKEADYGADYQDMVARVKKLAGLGPLKTVYDPQKRVYKNVPVAVQPKKEQR